MTLRNGLRFVVACAGIGFALMGVPLRAQQSEWVDLLPDESLKGWTRIPIPSISGVDPRMQWRVDPGTRTLICTGTGGHEWLRLDQELGDFILRVDWRFTPRGPDENKYNSGIGVRMTAFADIWHQAQTGPTGGYLFGQTITDGVVRRFNLLKEMIENRVKPAGEWNNYEIWVRGDQITMAVNGAGVNILWGVGLRRGYIGFEAEGYEVTFRNIKLMVLDPQGPPPPPPPRMAEPPFEATLRISWSIAREHLIHSEPVPCDGTPKSARFDALISETGTVIELSLHDGDPEFARRVADAVRKWRFRPVLLSSRAARMRTLIEVNCPR
ncbi:MAG: DUF1080 domain-containing protein [Bryobacterales bacterium]|nr:DUF1080 domain-containing protein [Bryobacterales bacterium]